MEEGVISCFTFCEEESLGKKNGGKGEKTGENIHRKCSKC